MKDLLRQLALEFDKLRPRVVLPAKGCLKYDYLVPGGYYNEMWDWDGYFIGCHLASRSKTESVYLKWLVLNFLNLMDDQGYIPGCITPQGPEEGHRRFALKPFLAQSAYWAAKKLDGSRRGTTTKKMSSPIGKKPSRTSSTVYSFGTMPSNPAPIIIRPLVMTILIGI